MPRDSHIARRCSDIEDALDYAAVQSQDNPRLGSYLAAHISVLISGVVEDCIEYLVIQRAGATGDSEVKEFVRVSIGRQFRNPTPDAIGDTLRTFDESYRNAYQSNVPPAAREALGSIVSNRMKLAHSGHSQTDFTVADVRQYFKQIVTLLEAVENILLPASSQTG